MGCARCGTDAAILEKDHTGSYVCPDCLKKAKEFKHPVYNKKAFLLPDSLLSMAAYHAKIFPDGSYMFRIHDCNTGIRLRGNLNDSIQLKEAIEKLKALESAMCEFRKHIIETYTVTPFP